MFIDSSSVKNQIKSIQPTLQKLLSKNIMSPLAYDVFSMETRLEHQCIILTETAHAKPKLFLYFLNMPLTWSKISI